LQLKGRGDPSLPRISRSAPDCSLQKLRRQAPDVAEPATNQRLTPGGRRRLCSEERRIFRIGIRDGCPPRCTSPAEFLDNRAAASSNAPARPRKCRDTASRRGSAGGWGGRERCYPGSLSPG